MESRDKDEQPGCETKGMAVHQLMKILGVRKEVNRIDRDKLAAQWDICVSMRQTSAHFMSSSPVSKTGSP